jgi:hypothetical protein
MALSHKKVVVRRFELALAWGYLPASGFVESGTVHLMEVDGRIKSLFLNDIKTIVYVRDFNLDDPTEPERIGRRTFAARPRGDGLWLRLGFRDGDSLEGLAGVDMGFLESLIEDRGVFLTPPDTRGNAQRVFVPRSAIRSLEVLGYVTAPSKKLAKQIEAAAQAGLFEE